MSRRGSWLSFLTPEEITELLGAHGLSVVEHASIDRWVSPPLWHRWGSALYAAENARIVRALVSEP